MMALLHQPRSQPEYRRDRSHADFMTRLCDPPHGRLFANKRQFANALERAVIAEGFDYVEHASIDDAEAYIANSNHQRLTHYIDQSTSHSYMDAQSS